MYEAQFGKIHQPVAESIPPIFFHRIAELIPLTNQNNYPV